MWGVISVTQLERMAYEDTRNPPHSFRMSIRLAISLAKQGEAYFKEKDYQRAYYTYMKFSHIFLDWMLQFCELEADENRTIREHLMSSCNEAIDILESLRLLLVDRDISYCKMLKETDIVTAEGKEYSDSGLENQEKNTDTGRNMLDKVRRRVDTLQYDPNSRMADSLYSQFPTLETSHRPEQAGEILPNEKVTGLPLMHPLNYLYDGAKVVGDHANIEHSLLSRPPPLLPNQESKHRYEERNPNRAPSLLPKPKKYTVTLPSSQFDNGLKSLRPVHIPPCLIDKFLALAQVNTTRDIETCGILCGHLRKHHLIITTLIIPHQTGTKNTCIATNEEDLLSHQINNDLLTLGWIHTHPTQTCFLSSVDLHTQHGYQLLLPEAIAIVCSPQANQVGVFRLTDPTGIQCMTRCTKEDPFHEHPELTQELIYGEVDVKWESSDPITVVDLRIPSSHATNGLADFS